MLKKPCSNSRAADSSSVAEKRIDEASTAFKTEKSRADAAYINAIEDNGDRMEESDEFGIRLPYVGISRTAHCVWNSAELQKYGRVCKELHTLCRFRRRSLSGVPHHQLSYVAVRMPNNTALDIVVERTSDAVKDVFEQLVKFPKLSTLSIIYNGTPPVIDSNVCFPRMEGLKGLRMSVNNRDFSHLLAPALRHLTGLTSLSVHVSDGLTSYSIPPFDGLTNLETLYITVNILLNNTGEHLFPPSLQLRSITITDGFKAAFANESVVLQFLEPYAGTVESLTLKSDFNGYTMSEWSSLGVFDRLQSLQLPESIHHNRSSLQVLTLLTNLTSLDVGTLVNVKAADVVQIAALTKLKLLKLRRDPGDIDADSEVLKPLHLATQLNHISLKNTAIGTELHSLTALTELEVSFDHYMRMDIVGTLRRMPDLLKLSIGRLPYCRNSVTAISEISNLQSLRIWFSSDIDSTFLRSLTALSRLTELHFGCCPTGAYHNWIEGSTQLRHLVGLTIESDLGIHPRDCLNNLELPELRKLSVRNYSFTADDIKNLTNKFPYLDVINDCQSLKMTHH